MQMDGKGDELFPSTWQSNKRGVVFASLGFRSCAD